MDKFINQIQTGFDSRDFKLLEIGLRNAYDQFVSHVTNDKSKNLNTLGRLLSEVSFPIIDKKASNADFEEAVYLGQMRSLIILCTYFADRSIPNELRMVAHKSKHAESILKVLDRNGGMLATELCNESEIPHSSELTRTAKPLIEAGIIRSEKFGKNVWYSLTAVGKLMMSRSNEKSKTAELINVVRSIFANLSQRQTDEELIDGIKTPLPNSEVRELSMAIISILSEKGLIAKEDNKWRLKVGYSVDFNPKSPPNYEVSSSYRRKMGKYYIFVSHKTNKDEIKYLQNIIESESESRLMASMT
jgi:predicted transcriptional regulator